MVIEILHSIGLCLLVFHLLPDLGAIQGIGLLSAAVIFPSFLKPLFSNDTTSSNWSGPKRVILKIVCFVLDLLAFFVQLSAIPAIIVPYTQYIHGNKTHTVNDVNIESQDIGSMGAGFAMDSSWESVKIVGALLLCSLSYGQLMGKCKNSQCIAPLFFVMVGELHR